MKDVWWFSLWAVQSANLHRTVILESQLPQRPVGLTVINCFKGMREQMVLIHRAAYPPSSVQKYSAVPLAAEPPAPACCAGSGLRLPWQHFQVLRMGCLFCHTSLHLFTLYSAAAGGSKTFKGTAQPKNQNSVDIYFLLSTKHLWSFTE